MPFCWLFRVTLYNYGPYTRHYYAFYTGNGCIIDSIKMLQGKIIVGGVAR